MPAIVKKLKNIRMISIVSIRFSLSKGKESLSALQMLRSKDLASNH